MSEKRIELIEELNEIATKLKIDYKKSFVSECGKSIDSEAESL